MTDINILSLPRADQGSIIGGLLRVVLSLLV